MQKPFKSLTELFEYRPPPGITPSERYIPICQHNNYSRLPFHLRSESAGQYTLAFPSHLLHVIEQLDLGETQLSHASLLSDEAASTYELRSDEDKQSATMMCTFHESSEWSVESLLEQIYLTYVNQFNFETWAEPLRSIELIDAKNERYPVTGRPVTMIDLASEEIAMIKQIYEETGQGRYLAQGMHAIMQLSDRIKQKLVSTSFVDGTAFFFKLNTRSAKDSKFYKDQALLSSISRRSNSNLEKQPLKRCQAITALDIVCAMCASERVYSDCKSWLEWRVKSHMKPPLKLILQKWIDFPSEFEFRCFVFDHNLNAINQLCWESYIPHLEQDQELQTRLRDSIVRLHRSIECSGSLPYANYILDAIYDRERDCAFVCELNPWGPWSCTGSQLFNWELDEDVLFGRSVRIDQNGNRLPQLRLLRQGMKVFDHFDLQIGDEIWDLIDDSLKSKIASAMQRCVCCLRQPRAGLPPKPETRLFRLSPPI
jgi:hypothetical protein